jgi:hypothetical protein
VSSAYHDDPLMQAIATLPAVVPNEASARQLGKKCRVLLERPSRRTSRTVEPATVSAVCALYAWQIVRVLVR